MGSVGKHRVHGDGCPFPRLKCPLTETSLLSRERSAILRPCSLAHCRRRAEAGDDYTSVHTKGRSYLVYLTLQDFERMLDGSTYVRIHRSHVVNMEHVAQFIPTDGGRFVLEMAVGTKLPVSRAYAKGLREKAV